MDYANGDVVTYAYDANGNRLTQTVNGVATNYSYDNADQLTDVNGTSYGYDANGNLTAAGSDTFSWDAHNQLTSATVNGSTTDYGYDGSSPTPTVGPPPLRPSPPPPPPPPPPGNQVSRTSNGTTTTNLWDTTSGMAQLVDDGSTSYVYNGDGLRVSKTVSSTTTDYTWDQTGIGQVISDGNDYVWGLGLISQIASGTPTYAHSDGLGSTRLLTDGSGSVVGTQQYDAFGATRSQSGTQLPFTYTGAQVDPESGLVYLRNRYLDPASGRFQTPDPLGAVGSGVNLYAYVGNNPATLTDPSGLTGPVDEYKDITNWQASSGGIPSGSEPPEYIPPLDAAYRAEAEAEIYGPEVPADLAISKADCPLDRGPSAGTSGQGWKVGDPIDAATKAGNDPSWSTVQSRYWKNEAAMNPENYSDANLERIRRGLAPKDEKWGTGASMELHHDPVPQRAGGSNAASNLQEVWPWEHAEIDPYRHYNGPRP